MDHTDAVPLPPRPDLAQYRKRAKDLVAADRSGGPDAIDEWAARWLATLAGLYGQPVTADLRQRVDRKAQQVAEFARRALAISDTLAAAQRVVARAHGFESWPKFAKHLEALAATTPTAAFETAVDAIVAGDLAALDSALRTRPDLVRARSPRRHQATLLHYVAANGVEGYRQLTTPNVVEIAGRLIEGGAEVDAPHSPTPRHRAGTALGLVATSAPAVRAGVQLALMRVLLDAGAAVDGIPGAWQPLAAALDNACPAAADLLARSGARTTIVTAAGLGRLDLVEHHLTAPGAGRPSPVEIGRALVLAAAYGHTGTVALLLDRGADPGAPDRAGQTALHLAAHGGHRDTVELLLDRRAPLEARNGYGGTVLGQAVWSAATSAGGWGGTNPGLDYLPIIERLLTAGARVAGIDLPTGHRDVDDLLTRHSRAVSQSSDDSSDQEHDR